MMFLLFGCTVLNFTIVAQQSINIDICVYGGTSAGVVAAYTAKKMGKSVVLIEPGQHLGGLSSGGLGYTDIGNKYAISGLARDFYRRIGRHYGKFEQWIFEPHVAEDIFKDYIKRANVNVVYGYRLQRVDKQQLNIESIVVEDSRNPTHVTNKIIKARMFIDCSYEGDLMAKAGVSYTVGRESNAVYNETFNGVQMKNKHQFPDGVSPYKIKDQASSGLLWGISAVPMQQQGSGDKKVQAYNFRICLSSDPVNQIPITQPDGYDPAKYELLLRLLEIEPQRPFNLILKPDLMPNNKTDINNNGPISTDMIGMNYAYPEADYATRAAIQKEHELYVKGLLYFIGHDPRMPEHLRKEMLRWGYPKDEYVDNDHWSPQMYVQEARRMIGAYVMTQANCQGQENVTDGIGMAAYTMDSHNCDRVIVLQDGLHMVKNEGDVQEGGFPPYPISYRAIVPKSNECSNLLVPVCLSASHIAYGSIRMEPVFMVLGQSSAVAATLAIDQKSGVQKVDIKKLQQTLVNNPLSDGSVAEILVDDADIKKVSGEWDIVTTGGYGPSFLVNSSKLPSAACFEPKIARSGLYEIYFYYPKVESPADAINIKVYDGKKWISKTIKKKNIKIMGQTSGEWVNLGIFKLPEGQKSCIEISNKNANGAIAADAVLFVPAVK